MEETAANSAMFLPTLRRSLQEGEDPHCLVQFDLFRKILADDEVLQRRRAAISTPLLR